MIGLITFFSELTQEGVGGEGGAGLCCTVPIRSVWPSAEALPI